MNSKQKSISWINLGWCVTGITLIVLGYKLWLIPYSINAGGITGACQLMFDAFKVPFTISSAIFNSGLFLYGLKRKGGAFVIGSVLCTCILTILLDFMPQPRAPITPYIPSAVIGSLVSGIGFGLVVRGGYSTGGSDMLGEIVHTAISKLSVGMVMNLFDGFVILASALYGGVSQLPTNILAMVCCNVAVDIAIALKVPNELCLPKLIKTKIRYYRLKLRKIEAPLHIGTTIKAVVGKEVITMKIIEIDTNDSD